MNANEVSSVHVRLVRRSVEPGRGLGDSVKFRQPRKCILDGALEDLETRIAGWNGWK